MNDLHSISTYEKIKSDSYIHQPVILETSCYYTHRFNKTVNRDNKNIENKMIQSTKFSLSFYFSKWQ